MMPVCRSSPAATSSVSKIAATMGYKFWKRGWRACEISAARTDGGIGVGSLNITSEYSYERVSGDSTRFLSEAVMSRYLDVLVTGGWRTIFAYPSSIYLLCLHARKQRRNLRRLGIKTVFVTGEVLFPHQRELISETLNCPVANGYGGRDSGFVAHECPQGGMHIMADASVVEILDSRGRPLPEGEPGEIVVTDLYSREVPFLRYATGDVGALSSRKCPCGRSLPLLERIEGRTTDFIVAPDGTILHALSVIYVMREIPGVEQFRIRQKALDRFHVQLVRNQHYQAESEVRIREKLRQRLRAPVEVLIDYLPELPPEPSGKYRYVISEIALHTTAKVAVD